MAEIVTRSVSEKNRGLQLGPRLRFLKLRTWLDWRQKPQVFEPEAQAKELAGIAREPSFACASGFDKRGLLTLSPA